MIVEWLLNLIISIIKLPISLLHIPSVDLTDFIDSFMPYVRSAADFVSFFFDDIAITIIEIAIGAIVLFKVVDIISTIVGFFKKTG